MRLEEVRETCLAKRSLRTGGRSVSGRFSRLEKLLFLWIFNYWIREVDILNSKEGLVMAIIDLIRK